MPNDVSPSSQDGPVRKSLLERLQVIIGIVVTVAAAYSAWRIDTVGTSLKAVEIEIKAVEGKIKESEEKRADRESIEKKQLLVYDAVVKSLESGDVKRQSVSKALVTAMLEDPLRTELLTVLTTSTSPEIQKEAQATIVQERTFKAEEGSIGLQFQNESKAEEGSVPTQTQGKPSEWGDWDFDIFWCERSGEAAKDKAEKIARQLEVKGAKGRLRVRLLPDSINARPGYQHTGYVIRYNTKEVDQANNLKKLGDQIVVHGAFLPSLSHQPTPWYLSAFVCPVSN